MAFVECSGAIRRSIRIASSTGVITVTPIPIPIPNPFQPTPLFLLSTTWIWGVAEGLPIGRRP